MQRGDMAYSKIHKIIKFGYNDVCRTWLNLNQIHYSDWKCNCNFKTGVHFVHISTLRQVDLFLYSKVQGFETL